MKLGDIAVDVKKIEAGAWVENIPELEGIRIQTRGMGNKDWRKLQQRLTDSLPRNKRVGGRIDPVEMDRIIALCLIETGIQNWEGLEDEEDKPILYSKDTAKKLLLDPVYGKFRDGALWAAQFVGEQKTEELEDKAGNS